MSRPQKPKPAKLVIGLFLKERNLILPVAKALTEKFGPIDMVSAWFPFNFTNYYESEMGASLFRRILVFETLIEQDALAEIKLITNDIELEYSKNGKEWSIWIRVICCMSVLCLPAARISATGYMSGGVFMLI